MRRAGTTEQCLLAAVEQAFGHAQGAWTGCDWPTSFGTSGLDLNGMTSFQALLMSRATSGVEAKDWREAVHWLGLIESDAEAAEKSAQWALQHALRGDLEAAARKAQSAVELESRYHPNPVWSELRRALEV